MGGLDQIISGPLIPILLVGAFIWYLTTFRKRDQVRIRRDFKNDPGEITEVKLVSLGSKNNPPRIYRVVLTLPNGGRLLHRVALFPDGRLERLL